MTDTIEIELHPITDEEGPQWVQDIAKKLVTQGRMTGAGLASMYGTKPDDEDGDTWLLVATAAQYDDRWQVHVSWLLNDGTHQAAYGVSHIEG